MVGDFEIPIRYCKVTPSVCRIFLCADVEVEPGTEQLIGARLEEGYEQNFGSPGILEEFSFPSSPKGRTDPYSNCQLLGQTCTCTHQLCKWQCHTY